MTSTSTVPVPGATPANRLGLDYTAEADRLGPPPTPIIDVHAHINGLEAVHVFRRAAEAYGIRMTYSMTRLEECEAIRTALDGRIRYIAVPDYWSKTDRRHAFGDGFLDRLRAYHGLGARIVKFWVAPRSIDYATEMGDPDFMRLDAPHRIAAMELASELGMIFMTHVADPDTWFRTRYADAGIYGTKRDQYEPFERLLDRFRQPWIAAHMGGWPEDLDFLSRLLDDHPNLYFDTSATKWMVRELGRHPRAALVSFLERYRGRILFGSDIVSADEHLHPSEDENEMAGKAHSEREAFDLYASRYWALRTMYETAYEGPSSIADPDLALVEPDRYTDMDAPPLVGRALNPELLRVLYHDAAAALLDPLHDA